MDKEGIGKLQNVVKPKKVSFPTEATSIPKASNNEWSKVTASKESKNLAPIQLVRLPRAANPQAMNKEEINALREELFG